MFSSPATRAFIVFVYAEEGFSAIVFGTDDAVGPMTSDSGSPPYRPDACWILPGRCGCRMARR